MPATICLAMIVKNESAVIERCLQAARPHIDAYAIVDTGSDDDTPEKVESVMKGIPGELKRSTWKGMSESRNEALDLARKQGCDYMLMLDADDVLVPGDGFSWPEDLKDDAYHVEFCMGSATWIRPALMRCDAGWRYEGAAHEHITGADIPTRRVPGLSIEARTDGYRRSTEGRSKYDRIAKILEEELERDPGNLRNMFYLAQSYRDAGRTELALKWYEKRVAAGGDEDEETWFAMFQVAMMEKKIDRPFDDVLKSFLDAYEYRPHRKEPLVEGARLCRAHSRHALGFVLASAACQIPVPTQEVLPVDASSHWRAIDEMAVCAFLIGNYAQSLQACKYLLDRSDLPDSERARVSNNLKASAAECQRILNEMGRQGQKNGG